MHCSASASSIPKCARVVLTSAKDRIFCSGANIFMLGLSSHAWKVNFCKFTNETRNGMEDSSRHSGLKFLAACNGTTAGGGYELALACDEILLVDDRSAAVSLPEVPLLGVLPGTGGLTRLTDKRKVRRDHADIFCTLDRRRSRAARQGMAARSTRCAKPQQFAGASPPPRAGARRIERSPAGCQGHRADSARCAPSMTHGYHYSHVDVRIDRRARTATLTVHAPRGRQPRISEKSCPGRELVAACRWRASWMMRS